MPQVGAQSQYSLPDVLILLVPLDQTPDRECVPQVMQPGSGRMGPAQAVAQLPEHGSYASIDQRSSHGGEKKGRALWLRDRALAQLSMPF
jgi:hypothetical protein